MIYPDWWSVTRADNQPIADLTVEGRCGQKEEALQDSKGHVDWARLLELVKYQGCEVWVADIDTAPLRLEIDDEVLEGVLESAATVSLRLSAPTGHNKEFSKIGLLAGWTGTKAGEWSNIPPGLLELNSTVDGLLRIAGLPRGYLDLVVKTSDAQYRLPRIFIGKSTDEVDLGEVTAPGPPILCGEIDRWTNGMGEFTVFWEGSGSEPSDRFAQRTEKGIFCLPPVRDHAIWVWARSDSQHVRPIEILVDEYKTSTLTLTSEMLDSVRLQWDSPEIQEANIRAFRTMRLGERDLLVLETETVIGREEVLKLAGRPPFLVLADPLGGSSEYSMAHGWVDDSSEVFLDFSLGTRISGKVTSDEGENLAGAKIRARLLLPEVQYLLPIAETRSKGDGAFDLEGLPEGRYRVEINKPNFRSQSMGIDVYRGEAEFVEVELDRGELIKGTVLRPRTRQPLGGAVVTLLGGTRRQTYSASDGTFAFKGLAPNSYSLLVEANEMKPEYRVVDLNAGDSIDLRITLSRGTRWNGEVSTDRGAVGQVTLLKGASRFTAPVASDSTFSLDNGPDGSVGFYLEQPDGGILCTGNVEIPVDLTTTNVLLEC